MTTNKIDLKKVNLEDYPELQRYKKQLEYTKTYIYKRRAEDPEYYKKCVMDTARRNKIRWETDPEYREKQKQWAKNTYHRRKEKRLAELERLKTKLVEEELSKKLDNVELS